MVALPKKWVKEMGLRQGSEIIITRPSLTTLLISADQVESPKVKREAVIEFTEKDSVEVVYRKVVSLYIQGYSQIGVKFINGGFNSTKRDSIKEMVRRHLIGTEAVADSRDRISIHVLLGYSELSAENALKKMLVIATSMQKDAMLALQNHDKNVAEGVIERDNEVDRFGLYVIRQLNMSISQGIFREEVLEPQDLLGYTLVVRILERIADHSRRICEKIIEMEEPLRASDIDKILPIGEFALNMVDSAMLTLFKRDNVGADLLFDKKRQFSEMLTTVRESFHDRLGAEEYHAVQLFLDSLARIVEYAGDIAEVVMNLTIERVVKQS